MEQRLPQERGNKTFSRKGWAK